MRVVLRVSFAGAEHAFDQSQRKCAHPIRFETNRSQRKFSRPLHILDVIFVPVGVCFCFVRLPNCELNGLKTGPETAKNTFSRTLEDNNTPKVS